jgi:hypothetical protein
MTDQRDQPTQRGGMPGDGVGRTDEVPDPRIHRFEEADTPTSTVRAPDNWGQAEEDRTRTGELDQAGGQAGQSEVDNVIELGDGQGHGDLGPADAPLDPQDPAAGSG